MQGRCHSAMPDPALSQDKNDVATWRLLPAAASAAYAAAPADAGGYSLPAGSGWGKFNAFSVNPDIPTLHMCVCMFEFT